MKLEPRTSGWLNRQVSRRNMLRTMGVALAGLGAMSVLGCTGGAKKGGVKWITNEPYAPKDLLDQFSQETGIKVDLELYGGTEEMFAKVKTGGTGITLISSTSFFNQNLYDARLIAPVDISRISNYEQMFKVFRGPEGCVWEDKVYGVPYTWGTDSIAYNADEVPQVDSIAMLWDPALKGRIAMPGTNLEALLVAAMYLGISDPFRMDDEELAAVKDALLRQKPLLRTYWNEVGELKNMFATGEVALAWSWSPVLALSKEGVNMKWATPKEGQLGWYDANFIAAGQTPEQEEGALALMDFCLGADYGVYLAREQAYRSTSVKTRDALSPDEAKELDLSDPDAFLQGVVWWEAVAEPAKYEQVWQEVLNA